MRFLISTLFLVLLTAPTIYSQHAGTTADNGTDLYQGIDQAFYSESSFGVKNPIYSAYPVSGMIRHNRVEGLFIGYQEEKMDWGNSNFFGLEYIDVHGSVGYSMALRNIQYSMGAEKSIGDHQKWLLLGFDIHRSVTTEDYWRSGLNENSISSFFTGFDFHDYYMTEGYGMYALLRPLGFLELGASYNVDRFQSLDATSEFSLISRYSTYRINPTIHNSMNSIGQQSVTLGLTLNPNKVRGNSWVWSTFSAKAEIANLANSGNDFLYNRYQAETKTFLRLDRSSLIKHRFMAGVITGEAPDFKNFAVGGIGSMRALGFKSLLGNEMLLSNLEIELGKSSPSKQHDWPDLSDFYISLFLDSGTSQTNPEFYDAANFFSDFNISLSDFSHNAGVGLGLGMLRLEVATPIAGAEGHTAFWIRINPTF